ncbi:MAG TPA: hypothetical protein HA272_01555 [Methanoregula sp.]|nr:hypothetical protein [Methanoregula sp.]
MTPDTAPTPPKSPEPRREFDFTLEPVILLVLAAFMLLFGLLLFRIHTGNLPYAPDSTYGLFLVIVALQVITLGKTPFGGIRRSWLVILIGLAAGILGMGACFIPGLLSAIVRTLVGVILTLGGAALLLQLVLDRRKAGTWISVGGILRHLTIACALVYSMAFLLGVVTLVPALRDNVMTAVLLVIEGGSLFYLAGCIQVAERTYPAAPKGSAPEERGACSFFLQDAPLPFTNALLIFLGTLLVFLAVLLVPINLGILPFSPDGQFGLLLVIMAIQVLAVGETPIGQFRRSWPIVLVGLVFVALGVFSCIVPGILTDVLRIMLAALNIAGGIIPLALRLWPVFQQMKNPPAVPVAIPAPLKKLLITQTVLNIVGILFGISMLLPGLIPGMVVAVILFCNGLLLFLLAYILGRLPAAA